MHIFENRIWNWLLTFQHIGDYNNFIDKLSNNSEYVDIKKKMKFKCNFIDKNQYVNLMIHKLFCIIMNIKFEKVWNVAGKLLFKKIIADICCGFESGFTDRR